MDPEATAEEIKNATSAVGLRRLVGYLGIGLPLLCCGYTIIWSRYWLPSISHYYYTPVHGAFTAILCGLGMVLYVYRGYDDWDRWATNIASLAAFGVGLFPTARGLKTDLPDLGRLFLDSEAVNGKIHSVSAISLFVMFFFISGFLFTRMPPTPGQKPSFKEFMDEVKKTWLFARTPVGTPATLRQKENTIHRRCAWIILVSIVLAAVSSLNKTQVPWLAIFETSAILGFATSWLAKNKLQPNIAKVIYGDVKLLVSKAKGQGPVTGPPV